MKLNLGIFSSRILSALFVLPIITAALLSAFAGSALAAESPKEVRIATVAYANGSKVGFNGSSGVIEKQGWLKRELEKYGVKLTWVPVTGQSVGATVNEGFASNSIDFAAYGDLPSIILNAGGVDTRIIVPGGRGNNVYLVVPVNSSAKNIVDLKGKRIALHRGRPWEVAFARLAAANGLKLADFKLTNLNPGAGAAALAAGNVDAFVTISDAYLLEDKNVGKIIWSTKTTHQDWKMRAEVWGSKAFIDQYPLVTQIVATAYVKAAYWSSQDANFDAYLQIAHVNGQPENVFRREYANDSVSWKQRWSPLFDEFVSDHYRYASAYSRQVKLIRKDLDSTQLFDPRFVKVALTELKLNDYWQASKISTPALR